MKSPKIEHPIPENSQRAYLQKSRDAPVPFSFALAGGDGWSAVAAQTHEAVAALDVWRLK